MDNRKPERLTAEEIKRQKELNAKAAAEAKKLLAEADSKPTKKKPAQKKAKKAGKKPEASGKSFLMVQALAADMVRRLSREARQR